MAVFARIQGLELTVVDCGVAEQMAPHERLLMRKIAHGTRNARVGGAMTLDQAHAAIRAGMEIADTLRGNVVACAGIGVGSHESAALVLSRLTDAPVRELLVSGPDMDPDALAHLMVIAQGAQGRHRDVSDPVEVLAAFGGFEIAMMVGVMLVAAQQAPADHGRRHAGLCGADGGLAHRAGGHRLLRVLPQPRPPRAGPGAAPVPRLGAARTGHGKHRRHRRHAGLAAGPQRRRAADRSGRRRGPGPVAAMPTSTHASAPALPATAPAAGTRVSALR